MQRRHFSALAAASLGLGLARSANAQGGAPVAGQDYKQVPSPAPVPAPPGTIDVVEFFSYACPHCFEFEPTLETWLKTRPAGVHFHRLPVRFLQNYTNFQPMYFTLEQMDLVDGLQQKVFNAVHLEHQRLDTPETISAFMKNNGVDATRFMAIFNSFAIRAKVQQANQLMETYGVDAVPTLIVGGTYQTSPTFTKSAERTTAVVDYLVAKMRSGH